jgi:hypothetical protein
MRMNKTQSVPCVVRTEGLAEEDSLAENVQRAALHPLDQFRALAHEETARRFIDLDADELRPFVCGAHRPFGDDGGWLQDPALLDHLVTEKA